MEGDREAWRKGDREAWRKGDREAQGLLADHWGVRFYGGQRPRQNKEVKSTKALFQKEPGSEGLVVT